MSREAPYDTSVNVVAWRYDRDKDDPSWGISISLNAEGVETTFENENDLHPIEITLSPKALKKMGFVDAEAQEVN